VTTDLGSELSDLRIVALNTAPLAQFSVAINLLTSSSKLAYLSREDHMNFWIANDEKRF
jgi:hypothetical protein